MPTFHAMTPTPISPWLWRLTAGLFAVLFFAPELLGLDAQAAELWWVAVGLLALASVGVALRLQAVSNRGPLRLLLASMLCFSGSNVLQLSHWGWPADHPVMLGIGMLYLAGYALTALSMVRLVGVRFPGGDPEGRIDGLIVMVSMSALLYDLLLGSGSPSGAIHPLNVRIFSVVALIQAPVVTAGVRLLIAGAHRLPSAWLYLAASVTGLVATLIFTLSGGEALPETAIFTWFAAYAFVSVASLHPSLVALTRPQPAAPGRMSIARLAVIGGALAALPATLLRSATRTDLNASVPAIAAVVCVVLVLWRIARLLQDRERASAELHLRADRDAALSVISRAAVTAAGLQEFVPALEAALEGTLGGRCRLIGALDDAADADALVAPLGGQDGWLVAEAGGASGSRSDDDRFLQTAADLAGAALRRWSAEAVVRHQSLHDVLTELPNRALVLDRLDLALVRARAEGRQVAVLFCDLDGFKEVNDTLGHAAGDELLIGVAQRLRDGVRPGDTVGRLAGDEFVVIGEDTDEEAARALGERLVALLAAPFGLELGEVTISVSVGVACIAPDADSDAERLLRDADAAMYRAKDLGKGRVAAFDEQLRLQRATRDRMEHELRGASGRGELSLVFQPLFALSADGGDEVVGAEALVRWHHPVDGPISPAEFIPLAEASGLIVPLGDWIMHEACRQAATWRMQLPPGRAFRLYVNVSPVQLADPRFVARMGRSIVETGADPTDLGIELTETAVIDSEEALAATLRHIRDLGVELALDDLGAGHTSLAQLRSLPFDLIKLDASLIARLAEPSRDRAIVTAIAGLAQELGLRMLAEGVETHEQLAAVRHLGFDQAQGYLLGRPGPPEQLLHLLGGSLPAVVAP